MSGNNRKYWDELHQNIICSTFYATVYNRDLANCHDHVTLGIHSKNPETHPHIIKDELWNRKMKSCFRVSHLWRDGVLLHLVPNIHWRRSSRSSRERRRSAHKNLRDTRVKLYHPRRTAIQTLYYHSKPVPELGRLSVSKLASRRRLLIWRSSSCSWNRKVEPVLLRQVYKRKSSFI